MLPRAEFDALIAALKGPEAGAVDAARKLAAHGDPAAVPALIEAFGLHGFWLRDSVMRIKHPAAVPHFIAALRSDDIAMQTLGEDYLVGLRVAEALPVIEPLLRHEDAVVRRAALRAYAELEGPPPLGPLLPALCGEEGDQRWAAVPAIWRVVEKSPLDAVLPYLGHADARVRAVLARAIGMRYGRDAAPALGRLADDPDVRVRWWVQVALDDVLRPGLKSWQPLEGHIGFSAPPY